MMNGKKYYNIIYCYPCQPQSKHISKFQRLLKWWKPQYDVSLTKDLGEGYKIEVLGEGIKYLR